MDPAVLLDGLDEEQRLAVASSAQPLVVLAPAGSGKTRVLTRRIAYQVATEAADARHVLALTFTRKAAGELTERLRRLGPRSEATAGTFHAVAWGVLRTRWADLRRDPPTLLDRKGRILSEIAPRVANRPVRAVAADLAGEIEWAKARMITPDAYEEAVAAAGRRPPMRPVLVAEAYATYEHRKQRSGLVDFDDVLALCARAIEDDEVFARAQRWRFRHLFVDELQDVNALQFRLLEAWRGDRYDVTAVGDPQQAIYGWNGADAGFLLDIHRHWPPAQVIQLRTSYRSTPQILRAAAQVLRGARQPAQEVEPVRPDGLSPHLAGHPTDRDEAIAVARAVRLAHAPGRPWADQAVLVRTHAQTVLLAEALREAGIPHRLRGGAAFLDRPEVRRAIQELRQQDEPLGTALADLEASIDADLGLAPTPGPGLDGADADARAEAAGMVAALVRMGQDYLRLDPLGRTDTFVRWLYATVQSEGDAGTGGDAVDVATFHAAKGLEWGVVHLAGVEDGYVPIAHARTAAAKAEEARLLYVAMTRAQRQLRISWADVRTFASKVVERRRSPLLDPLMATYRPEDAVPTALATGPIEPPVEDFAEQVAAQREALATLRRAEVPGLEDLHRWREGAARAARTAPVAILPDHVLARIARERPRDLDELAEVRGVGVILAHRFGPAILAALTAEHGALEDRADGSAGPTARETTR